MSSTQSVFQQLLVELASLHALSKTSSLHHATKGGTGAESEFGLTYTMGALTVGYARDTGQTGMLVMKPKL
jgi:hypothetical protein